MEVKVVGIDLAGSENRPTGFCAMTEKLVVKTNIVYKDCEIIDLIKSTMPRVAAIDAPLSLPRGRASLEAREPYHLRECDRELMKMRIRFFPITLGPMRRLTERGMRLKPIIEQLGVEVIEVYPGGAQDVLRIPRKHVSLEGLLRGLRRLGIKGLRRDMSGDELDAVTCAFVGYLYLKGEYVALGDKEEGTIIMPKAEIRR
jgi:predicted nuclease with RNAse H fold